MQDNQCLHETGRNLIHELPNQLQREELSHMVGTGTMASPVIFRDVVSIGVSFMSSPVNPRVGYEFVSQSTSMSMNPHEV